MSGNENDAVHTQTILIIVNLILTSVVAIVTAMRCRVKCGGNYCSFKPRSAAYSPGSDIEQGSPVTSPAQPMLPQNAVAVVMNDQFRK